MIRFRIVVRVGRVRRSVTNVPEEWPYSRGNAMDRTRLTGRLTQIFLRGCGRFLPPPCGEVEICVSKFRVGDRVRTPSPTRKIPSLRSVFFDLATRGLVYLTHADRLPYQ